MRSIIRFPKRSKHTLEIRPKTRVTSRKNRFFAVLATILIASGFMVGISPAAYAATNTFNIQGFCDGNYTCSPANGSNSSWTLNFDDGPDVTPAQNHELFGTQNDTMSSFTISGHTWSHPYYANEQTTIHMDFYRDNYERVLLGSYVHYMRPPYTTVPQRLAFAQGINPLPWNDQVSSVSIWVSRP